MRRGWLREKFAEFVVELEKQKAAVRKGGWAFSESSVAFDPEESGGRGPNPSWEALASLLRKQADEAKRSGASGEAVYREAQYAMVALADEVFITLLGEWPGRDDWKSYHLEMAIFGSQICGTEIFRRIDRLLARRDPGQRDLAEVYFNVLTLGFRGSYATGLYTSPTGAPGAAPPDVEERRTQLHDFCSDGERADSGWVSPEAYEHVRSRETGDRLPSPLQSLTFLAVVVLCLSLASCASSVFLSGDIESTIDDTRAQIDALDAAP